MLDKIRTLAGGVIAATLALAMVATVPVPAGAASPQDADDLAERVHRSAEVLGAIMNAEDNSVPEWLLERAHCVAVIPGVVKAAFLAGGRHGKGVASCRVDNEWSKPTFVQISGASFGLQIGAESSDFVLVFTGSNAVDALSSDQLTLGGNASVAAGPVGRTAEAGTNARLEAEIYAYSRSRGAFAGISIEGAELSDDDDANRMAYNETVETKMLLTDSDGAPEVFGPFLNALRTHVPSHSGHESS